MKLDFLVRFHYESVDMWMWVIPIYYWPFSLIYRKANRPNYAQCTVIKSVRAMNSAFEEGSKLGLVCSSLAFYALLICNGPLMAWLGIFFLNYNGSPLAHKYRVWFHLLYPAHLYYTYIGRCRNRTQACCVESKNVHLAWFIKTTKWFY